MVTKGHVVVIACSRWRRNRPKAIWEQYPRSTRLGPVDVHPSLGPTITVGNLTLEVDEEYVSVIRAADLEIAGTGHRPDDPLPDL